MPACGEAHVNDLLAAVALVPATAEIEAISAGVYTKVHCRAAGSVPAGAVRVRFRVTLPPGVVLADDNANVSFCADALAANPNRINTKIRFLCKLKAPNSTFADARRSKSPGYRRPELQG